VELAPQDAALRWADGKHVVLRQGDEIEVKFDVPMDLRWRSAALVAKGYYVPVGPGLERGSNQQ
jgi:hypothetical protein